MVQMISESKRKIAALALAGAMAIGGAAGVATTIASPAQNQSGIVMEAEAAATPAVGDWVKCTVKSGNVYQTFDGAKSQNSSNIVGSLKQGQLKQIKEIKTAKINGNTKYFYKIPYDTKSTNGYAWINSAIVSTDLQIEEYMQTATKNTNICRDKDGNSIGSVVVNTSILGNMTMRSSKKYCKRRKFAILA